jgi:serine/threonine-protein phosphatase 2A regulatory subunit B''
MFDAISSAKSDEYFVEWLINPVNTTVFAAIAKLATDLESGIDADFDLSLFDTIAPGPTSRVKPPTAVHSVTRIDNAIPPVGPAAPTESEIADLTRVCAVGVTPENVAELFFTHCRLPRCFAHVICAREQFTPDAFQSFWKSLMLGRDPNERFFKLIVGAQDRNFIFPSELDVFTRALVENHPSLDFLHQEGPFQEKFIEFVIARAFFVMDPELRGTVGLRQFRRVDLAGIFTRAEAMDDVNTAQHIFNYQHFYVTYCKFWDLDSDSDGFISKDDLFKFNESAISPPIVNRYMVAPFFPRTDSRRDKVDFCSFSYFLLCTEDKTSPTAIRFWFRLCDLDDDGVLSVKEIEELYDVQFERLRITGNETIAFPDILRQLLDMVKPENPSFVSLNDLLRSKTADVFFSTLFDLQKFLIREYQFPTVNPSFDERTKDLTPWELYVLVEYDRLVNEG